MKNLIFFFVFLFASSIYSQTACHPSYGITVTPPGAIPCVYVFTPNIPGGAPSICSYDWEIRSSNATYGSSCDSYVNQNTLTYNFCFSGNHDVIMTINFCSGASCYVKITVNVTCSGAPVCDPDPNRITVVPDPVVEITYKAPVVCATSQGSPVGGCMYTNNGGLYDISCAWQWALRVPPTSYSCEFFTYYVEYTDAIANDCSTFPCVRHTLDTNLLCITAKMGTLISVVAVGNHCCLPPGYERGYTWTPTYGGSNNPIGPPTTTLGTCSAYRACPNGNSGNCSETQYTISQGSGWPSPPNCAITIVNQRLEQRNQNKLNERMNIVQDVFIFNIQGVEVFNGKWKFGNTNDLYLDWPKNLGSGLYLVKFKNSDKLTKLFKFN